MIFLTSDLHFCHNREFVYKPRGFESVEDMNEAIVSRWNSCVENDDEVYVLGDLMLNDNQKGIELIKRLNGKIHIVLGNHDTATRIKEYEKCPNVVEIAHAIQLNHMGYHFFLCHYPTLTGNLEKESLRQMTLNLFGHTHQQTNFHEDRPYMYHVGVDSHNCTPVSLLAIVHEMNQKVDECKNML